MIMTLEPTTVAPGEPATAGESCSVPSLDDWQLMYRTNAGPLHRYLMRLTLGNREEAEDHLQETFLRAWRWVQQHPTDLTTIRPWLYTVARRIVIDAARSRKVRPTEVLFDEATQRATGNDVDRFVLVQSVRDALRSLTPEHRAALVELFYRQHTAKEAAEILGIPEGTVKSRVHYALRALRAEGLGDVCASAA
ncbi:MAG TPA: sigma-70 family RNA polymerase sigma factor [Micromonosporaceae bacterium]|jgi:RNA polymerase sigma-70 factor (ECF subfamily)